MFKNIFRHRRRSRNEPFNDENEPVTRIQSQSKNILPDDAYHEADDFSSQQDRDKQRNLQAFQLRSTENISSAVDIRRQHFDTEHINKAVSSSQVTGHIEKYNSGHRPSRRHRLSSVVNKILLTHSESKQTPRTRRMVASGGFWTNEQSNRNTGIPASDKHREEDADNVFNVPYSCQCCAGTALLGDASKERLEDSWTCSQCRIRLTKSRDRHVSAESSPAALITPTIDTLRADNAKMLYPMKDFSRENYEGSCNRQCSHDCSCGYCTNTVNTYSRGQYYSAENVSDYDSTPYHENVSNVPSPLHIGDLEFHESELLEEDDAIPELVEISPHPRRSSCTGDAVHDKNVSSTVVEPAVETGGKNANESEMYILTDSFLDDSFASFVHSAAASGSSQSTTVRRIYSEVMVADDYQVMYSSKMNDGNSHNLTSSTEGPTWLPVVSPQSAANAEEPFPEPSEKAETPGEEAWCRKSLSEWSTDDVLHWVVSVGLAQFYDTFSSKLLLIYYQ